MCLVKLSSLNHNLNMSNDSIRKPVYAFIDASNLFYGGEKSLGWKIDYKKLLNYLKDKYKISKAFYYGGIETFGFEYSVLSGKQIDLKILLKYLKSEIRKPKISEEKVVLIGRSIKRVEFYLHLDQFGYHLYLKPVKIFKDENGHQSKKANCDVDMTFDMMRYMGQYSGLIALTGDGDFAPVLYYLKKHGRTITILARGERTAKEIKQLAGSDFRDFNYLREILKFEK